MSDLPLNGADLAESGAKRQYDRDFLLGFQFMPACTQKPEGLPPISDVVLDKVNETRVDTRLHSNIPLPPPTSWRSRSHNSLPSWSLSYEDVHEDFLSVQPFALSNEPEML